MNKKVKYGRLCACDYSVKRNFTGGWDGFMLHHTVLHDGSACEIGVPGSIGDGRPWTFCSMRIVPHLLGKETGKWGCIYIWYCSYIHGPCTLLLACVDSCSKAIV